MTLGTLIAAHGYWVLALGCLLEGETVLVLAGLRHTVATWTSSPWWVLLQWRASQATSSTSGSAAGMATPLLSRWPFVARQADRMHSLLERFHTAVIIGVRFAYGLRLAGPLLIGTTSIPALRFTLLNALGAVLWACAISSLGWVFGEAAESALGQARHLEGWLLLGLLAIGLWVWWYRKRRARSRT